MTRLGHAGAVVVGGVDAHAGARHSVFAVGDSGRHAFLGERTVAIVDVELVRLGIVGRSADVGPAVLVVIEDRDAQALRSRIVEPAFFVASSKVPLPMLCQSRTEAPL